MVQSERVGELSEALASLNSYLGVNVTTLPLYKPFMQQVEAI